ncbi:Hypothetical Protein RradSPS_0682 [Rubrobacter radiotolerans]|uniref:Uncharacterized protein n=1 Tax=Rubrobacter radiotolerans TaxID=42256 RepID=A0A023X1T2_RUBRA|nr:hypothetical protein [Rubrobacter radiotolerans]AHY45965.1 Hypothetical Protein RradSPS_0682 [Rubrobacter radiotolerans]MDX5893378.1 hypothetical protein [Rubrobacter radiotolerans]SMC03608.1 conserved hypothetical protein [Rubrobacter radiotolerans DSM 5868]
MFQDLDWGWALKRAGIVVLIYLVLMYVLSTVAPETFGLQSAAEWVPLLINAVLFFFVFTLVYAFIERSRRRRLGGGTNAKSDRNAKAKADGDDEPREPGKLKGKANPNTSRRKATRRRR